MTGTQVRTAGLDRRQFIAGTGSVTLLGLGAPSCTAAETVRGRKFVLIILRGGMDGLHLLPAYGEPSYAQARGAIAIAPPGSEKGALKLDGLFALHPSLPGLHGLYQGGEALFVPAVAPPYAARSHFSAQDVLENGTLSRTATNGWLARAMGARAGAKNPAGIQALSFGNAMTPLVLQGNDYVAAWSPGDPAMAERTKKAIGAAMARDPLFAANFAHGASLDALSAVAPRQFRGDAPQDWAAMTAAAGRLMTAAMGPDTAVINLFGWDSHAYMGGADGNWSLLAKALDGAITGLKDGLGAAWAETAAVAVTEFGRTIAVNGTGGTDHGVGGAAIVLGGRVNGGRLAGDWPGLRPQDRYEGRDVCPAVDMRALFKGILAEHWGLEDGVLGATVFPDSAHVGPLHGLLTA